MYMSLARSMYIHVYALYLPIAYTYSWLEKYEDTYIKYDRNMYVHTSGYSTGVCRIYSVEMSYIHMKCTSM